MRHFRNSFVGGAMPAVMLLALMLLALRSGGQELPQNPTENQTAGSAHVDAPFSGLKWEQVMALPRGSRISVKFVAGPKERCYFAGATDEFLFCDRDERDGGMNAFRYGRAEISSVKIDHSERTGKLVLAGFVLTGGLALGIRGSSDPSAGVLLGMLGAGLGGMVGYPVACATGFCPSLPPLPVMGPPMYGVGVNVPLSRLSSRRVWHPRNR